MKYDKLLLMFVRVYCLKLFCLQNVHEHLLVFDHAISFTDMGNFSMNISESVINIDEYIQHDRQVLQVLPDDVSERNSTLTEGKVIFHAIHLDSKCDWISMCSFDASCDFNHRILPTSSIYIDWRDIYRFFRGKYGNFKHTRYYSV